MSLFKNLIYTILSKNSKQKQELETQKEILSTSPLLKENKKTTNTDGVEIDPFLFPTKNKKKTTTFKKPTKFHQVRLHLLNKGTINSWTAIELYGVTRLSDIIFRLRGRGMNITSIPCSALDRNSNICNYTTYKLEN